LPERISFVFLGLSDELHRTFGPYAMMASMRSRIHAVVLPQSELGEFADEVRAIFTQLGRASGVDALTGECAPPIDVYEKDATVEISVDLPGVDVASVRIAVKGTAVLIAGEKSARRRQGDSSFHLVERGFGRFARVVRVSTPFDARQARAALVNGELMISLPKVAERRGRAIAIPIT
jgi:HSP20 family protein